MCSRNDCRAGRKRKNVWREDGQSYADRYACNDDGTLGDLLGTYRFDDTGYGAETGYGDSIILEDKSIGTIENGTCIDFYRENESDCWSYGRRDVYIVIKN